MPEDSWGLWGRAIALPFLAQEVLRLEVPSSILDSVSERCSLQPGSYWAVVEPVRGSAWLGIRWLCEKGHACDQRAGFLSAGLFLFIFFSLLPPLFSPPLLQHLFSALPLAKPHIQINGSSQPWSALSGTISQNKPFVLLKWFCLTKLCTMHLVILIPHSQAPLLLQPLFSVSSPLTFLPSFSVWPTEFI